MNTQQPTTDIATTDIATTDIATTDIATTDTGITGTGITHTVLSDTVIRYYLQRGRRERAHAFRRAYRWLAAPLRRARAPRRRLDAAAAGPALAGRPC